MFHPEPAPGARERYQKEILRVWGVLESVLKNREWLVGDKCTIADLSFIPCVVERDGGTACRESDSLTVTIG